MPPAPARHVAFAALLLAAGCTPIEGGSIDAAKAACEALCDAQSRSPGCVDTNDACYAACIEDANGFSERCLLAAQRYYECGVEVAWSCPVAPNRAETDDARCAAEEHAWLVCKVTGDLPPTL